MINLKRCIKGLCVLTTIVIDCKSQRTLIAFSWCFITQHDTREAYLRDEVVELDDNDI